MNSEYDFIIVGGGILGCASALSIARRKLGRVLVIERTTLGAQTTSRAAALVTRSRDHGDDRAMIARTHDMMRVLKTEYGEDIPYRRVGSLHVAESPQTAQSISDAMAALSLEGVEVTWIAQQEAENRAGWLSVQQAEAIAYVADDGYIDPYILCAAYARAAKSEGVSFRQATQVVRMTPTSVETDDGKLYGCEQVIVTTGPWMNRLLGKVPMAPVRSQYWITAPHGAVKPDGPVVILPDARAYARPEVGCLLFGVRDDEAVYAPPSALPNDLGGFCFNDDFDGWDSLSRCVDPFLERCPLLAETEISHYISGPSSYTPDGKYIVGRLDGFIVAGGACGAGIAISGGMGEMVARQIDSATPVSKRYDPNRFGPVDGHADPFLRQCAQSRTEKRAG